MLCDRCAILTCRERIKVLDLTKRGDRLSLMGAIDRIVIVGGGTAGWLSACYLQRALQSNVHIVLIESATVGRLGVGEATLPTLGATMRFLGFRDSEWMPGVGATYKSAIRFADWRPPDLANERAYWHPFISRPEPMASPHEVPFFREISPGVSLLHYALKRRLEGNKEEIARQLNPMPALCEAGRSPVHPDRPELDLPHAYHIDANRLADFLRDRGKQRGIEHAIGHVADVSLTEEGFIESVRTEDGRTFAGDLFIDCTGFRGMLINKTLDVPFRSDAASLLCDRAVAIQCESADENMPPFSTATALQHGWMWHIPLMARDGCGYVYSSEFADQDTAESELRANLLSKPVADKALHLRMRVGYTEQMWVKNCVAIGLSGCFIEPLESTGIFLVEYGLALLTTLFPSREFNQAIARRYNRAMIDMYSQIKDFIVLHYILSRRSDTAFWRAIENDMLVPDSLQEKLECMRYSLPLLDKLELTAFRAYNYSCILDGNDALPQCDYPLTHHSGYEAGFKMLDEIKERTRMLAETMPTHGSVLQSMQPD